MKAVSFAIMQQRVRTGFLCLLLVFGSMGLWSCQHIDLYEKNLPIPGHQWQSSFKPEFEFTITDTAATYQLYIVLRHTEKYNWNNMWVNMEAQMPGGARQLFKLELPLATNEKGWLGSAMDDIYEHRVPLILDPEKFNFNKSGSYKFAVQHIMREDPLQHVMNIGLRVEKKPG